uniref:Fumarylacetoacetase-like C-terminal domain-containing protein n=1 Tax=Fibrocapsa japonica TaxID=94617 RepID=A0A7S2UUB8_9STRA|mmetsp:Transcript_13879/g.20478  ORF Transcript_13879/g.20478 Transcript_13879/m.20478 type:complete len:302 (+) Transcript_13879:1-906(+)
MCGAFSSLAPLAKAFKDARASPFKPLSLDLASQMQKMTLEDAYEVQRLTYPNSSDIIGAKCGATAEKGMKAFKISEPFRALLPSGCAIQATSDPNAVLEIPKSKLGGSDLRGGESEWCFRLSNHAGEWDNLERTGKGGHVVDEDYVLSFVDDVFPAVEVCGSRMVQYVENGVELTPPMKIADGGGNGMVVLGDNRSLSGDADISLEDKLHQLAARKIVALVNGQVKAEGSGQDVLGHPLKSLTWLFNHFIARGEIATMMDLKGKFVMTGTCTGMERVQLGEVFEAQFEGYEGGIKFKFIDK